MKLFKRLFCYHKWKVIYHSRYHITFECKECGKTLFLNLDLPTNESKHIWHFDGYELAHTYLFHCKHCGKKLKITEHFE